jgi:hypothetical protein
MDDRIHTENDFGAVRRESAGEAGIVLSPLPGIEQGLASTALGMAFVVGGPVTMILIHILWHSHFDGFNHLDIVLITVCGILGILFVLATSVFGLIFGISAIAMARQHHRPIALGLGGALLNGFDVLLWLFILVLWVVAVISHH